MSYRKQYSLHISMGHSMMWIFYYGLIASSSAQEPRNTTCVGNYKLSFFYELKTFSQARAACGAYDGGSYLVKTDNAEITEAINSVIEIGSDGFFIGAWGIDNPKYPGDGTKRIWKWLNGSKIYLPSEQGYQDWKPGQPNDHANQEDCMAVGQWTTQWIDTFCGDGSPPQPSKYICQKYTPPKVEINSFTPNAHACIASTVSCATIKVEWRLGNVTISNNNFNTVYQTTSLGSSILHHANATIGDAGEYVCVAWVGSKISNHYISESLHLTVNGTPSIIDILSFACNTSLLVLWRPHPGALGFHHIIEVASSSALEEKKKYIDIIPNKTDQHFTELVGLQQFTKYSVQISACVNENKCSNTSTVGMTATTLGTTLTVNNASIKQLVDNDTCVVTWQWQHNVSTVFQITSEYTLNTTCIETSYSFKPLDDQIYVVEIQPLVTNKTYCSHPVTAAGSCGRKKSESGIIPDKQTSLTTVVIPVVAVVFLLLIITVAVCVICKRNNKARARSTSIPDDVNVTSHPTVSNEYNRLEFKPTAPVIRADEIEGNDNKATTPSEDKSNDDFYTMATDLHSSTDPPINAAVNKIINIENHDSGGNSTENILQNTTYDTTDGHQSNTDAASSSSTNAALSVSQDTDQDVYSVVDKSKTRKK